MPQSLSYLLIHVIFSTKDRRPCLQADLRPGLFSYLATVCRDHECDCPRVGGTDDHVHLAIRLSRTVAVADLVKALKTASAHWIKTQSPALSDFAWQAGYGAFSVGPADLDALLAYIDNQDAHHRTRTFQEEYRAFLAKYEVPYDERHLWG